MPYFLHSAERHCNAIRAQNGRMHLAIMHTLSSLQMVSILVQAIGTFQIDGIVDAMRQLDNAIMKLENCAVNDSGCSTRSRASFKPKCDHWSENDANFVRLSWSAHTYLNALTYILNYALAIYAGVFLGLFHHHRLFLAFFAAI